MIINLNDILAISAPDQYKLHLACRERRGNNPNPLDEFVRDPDAWVGWNEWRGSRNDWTRPHVLSFMEFYPQSDTWLFGGAFEVLERRPDGYSLRADEHLEKYVGRLLASFHRRRGMLGRAYYLETCLDEFEVSEILPQVYAGENFPGFEKVNHNFSTLESVFRTERQDWQAALGSVKGVYVITDTNNGKHYVGSAYGDGGIWSRWACYMGTGHGWNDELVTLIRQNGQDYARDHFRFAILEVMSGAISDDAVQAREGHWKRALLSREHGYNRN